MKILLSRAYGQFGDFGQSIWRPVAWLFVTTVLALFGHAAILGRASKACYKISETCRPNWPLWFEAIQRASVAAIPPFTTLAKRVPPSTVDVKFGATEADNAATEILMLSQGMFATVLVFLLLLAVKRLLQFKKSEAHRSQ